MEEKTPGKENHYFPLRLRSKFAHKSHGFVPSKKHKKWKRWFLSNYSQTSETSITDFNKILFQMYINMKQLLDSDIGARPDLLRCFQKIIPKEYYGSLFNRQKLFFIIKRIITQTQGEYIHISALYKNFQYEDMKWLTTEDNFMDQVLQANILLIQTVIKPFIRSCYYFLASFKDYGFSVIPRGEGDAFFDKSKNKICKLGHIRLVEATESVTQTPLGNLSLLPKFGFSDTEYRPIVRTNNKVPINKIEIDIKAIKLGLKRMAKKQQIIGGTLQFYDKWINFLQKSENKKRLYAIKLDLFDAFGFINIDKLTELIIQPSKEGFLLNHEVKYLLDLLSNQYVTIRGQKEIYKWEHGLLQGLHLSPLLCELYLSHITKDCFKGFDMTNCFFHRAVDDILFISTNEDKLNEFELLVFSMEILNQGKTQRYLEENADDPNILFCGKLINMETRETCTPHNYKKGDDLSCKFKLWNRKKQFGDDDAYSFLENAMQYSPLNHFFSKFDLNTVCNSVDTVAKNIFHGMCYVAIKLIFAVETIQYLVVDGKNCCQVVIKIIQYIQRRYPRYIEKTVQKSKGKYYKDILSEKLFKFLCYKAFYVIFQKKSATYKEVLTYLKEKSEVYILDLKYNVDIQYISTIPDAFRNVKCGRNTVSY